MSFEVVCEIEPATTPDLTRVRDQIAVLGPIADAYLVPDNHLGRATVSSVAVAHEVQAGGGRAIACLNARDRNLLGFRRDLLTAAAYGVDEFLFVYGDRPRSGARTSELTVRTMLEEGRAYAAALERPMHFGAATALGPVPAWKRAADFLFVQVGADLDDLVSWRATLDAPCPVYAGVLVLASAAMAERVRRDIPGLQVPAALAARLAHDPDAGVEAACTLVEAVRDSGVFDGVHLVPVARARQVVARLGHG